VSLCRSKTSSSDKCLECPQQQPSKLAWRPHRTSSVASTFDADRPLRDATQPNKNWKISTHPNPWVNLTHGQLWYKHAPVAIQPASPSQTAPRLWSHAQPNSATFSTCNWSEHVPQYGGSKPNVSHGSLGPRESAAVATRSARPFSRA